MEDFASAADAYVDESRASATCVRASELATRLSMTPARLAIAFQRAVGVGVKAYLRQRQIEYAQELLRTTSLSTKEIAVRAGFGTSRTLFRVFRKHTGYSPTEYRKELSLDVPVGR